MARNPNNPTAVAMKMALAMKDRAVKTHHLDRRAADLAVNGSTGNPDDLLATPAVAAWLGVSTQWLEIGRHRGYGPPFIRQSVRRVRYRRSDVIAWLEERTHRCTSEYMKRAEAVEA